MRLRYFWRKVIVTGVSGLVDSTHDRGTVPPAGHGPAVVVANNAWTIGTPRLRSVRRRWLRLGDLRLDDLIQLVRSVPSVANAAGQAAARARSTAAAVWAKICARFANGAGWLWQRAGGWRCATERRRVVQHCWKLLRRYGSVATNGQSRG